MRTKTIKGFTLLELTIALALGTVLTVMLLQVFKQASDTSFLVAQRSTVQADGRAALNAITTDVNLAGAGLRAGGMAVHANSAFGCTSAGTCGVWGFPTETGQKTLYGLMPGFARGDYVNGTATDAITIAYSDRSSALELCSKAPCGYDALPVTVNVGPPITLTFNANLSPNLLDPKVGFLVGDMVLLSNSRGEAAGVVTSINESGNLHQLVLGNDSLRINQSTGPGSISSLMTGSPITSATKLNLITYFVRLNNGPDGAPGTRDDLPPRLMRQVGARPPVVVADGINTLTTSFTLYDSNVGNENASPPILPLVSDVKTWGALAEKYANIRAIKVVLVAAGTEKQGVIGVQQMPLTTTISPRGLSFQDRYPNPDGSNGL